MKKLTLPILLLAFAGAAFAAEPQTIELKDGGKISFGGVFDIGRDQLARIENVTSRPS